MIDGQAWVSRLLFALMAFYVTFLAASSIASRSQAPRQLGRNRAPDWFGGKAKPECSEEGCPSDAGVTEEASAGGSDSRTARRLVEVPNKTMSFTVCNGMANQKLALLSGMILARELGRDLVLPRLILDGRQEDPSVTNYGSSEDGSGTVLLSDFYDAAHLASALAALGVQTATEPDPSTPSASVPEEDTALALTGLHRDVAHLRFGCPLLRLGPDVILRNEAFVFGVLDALQPNSSLASQVAGAVAGLRKRSSSSAFNFLHLRVETDWIHHCTSWRAGHGEADNCFTNTLEIARHLQTKGVEPSAGPLFVAFDEAAALPPILQALLSSLRDAGFSVVTHRDLFGQPPAGTTQHREVNALLEYSLALAATKFVGNSVSTFSALLLLERQHRSLWASYYNLGDIPLGSFMPLYTMPWVFTYNSAASPGLDHMLKEAVQSAKAARLTPFCLYNGTDRDPIYRWMRVQGVRITLHAPDWLQRMEAAFPAAAANAKWSPLYTSLDSLFGTFQRIDIPIMTDLEQFNYVLFTDADVVFQRPITLQSFGQPLPRALSMAYEMEDIFPCNAGVMLLNLPALRATYDRFIDFVFTSPDLYYKGYGPGDQGAYNQFYEQAMGRRCALSEVFNAKPYKNAALVRDSFIVHFHGPKPIDYINWHETGTCAFGRMCAKGYKAACRVIHKHLTYLPSCTLGGALADLARS